MKHKKSIKTNKSIKNFKVNITPEFFLSRLKKSLDSIPEKELIEELINLKKENENYLKERLKPYNIENINTDYMKDINPGILLAQEITNNRLKTFDLMINRKWARRIIKENTSDDKLI